MHLFSARKTELFFTHKCCPQHTSTDYAFVWFRWLRIFSQVRTLRLFHLRTLHCHQSSCRAPAATGVLQYGDPLELDSRWCESFRELCRIDLSSFTFRFDRRHARRDSRGRRQAWRYYRSMFTGTWFARSRLSVSKVCQLNCFNRFLAIFKSLYRCF